MVSTSVYYKVCADLIKEVYVVFRPGYYHLGMDEETESAKNLLDCFSLLDEHGFDQVPTGSNYFTDGNMEALVRYSYENLESQKLLGPMQTPG